MATKERTALIAEERADDSDFQPEDYPSQEPTQKLLTALGRFQRQVKMGETGAPQDQWSDECMNQLIEATEVAFAEGWTEVVRALTQAAQILQTYEDANRADLCVPFLSSCYKILCLMAGDLIVDQIRPGVLQKWGECYQRASQDVLADGLELVTLEGIDTTASTQEKELPSNVTVLPIHGRDAVAKDESSADHEDDDDLDDVPVLDDLPPIEDESVAHEDSAPLETEEVPEALPLMDDGDEDELPPLPSMHSITHLDDTVEGDAGADAGEEKKSIPPEVEDVLDKLCEPLSRMDRIPENRDSRPVFDALGKSVSALKTYASNNEFYSAVALCETMWSLCQAAYDSKAGREDKFVELAYAFCGHFVETTRNPTDNEAEVWVVECDALIEEWNTSGLVATEDEPAPELDTDDAGDEDTDMSLIEHISNLEAQTENGAQKVESSEAAGNDDAHESDASAELEEIELVETIDEEDTPSAETTEVDVPDNDAVAEDNTVQSLLSSAQGALSQGNSGQAKLLALHAVAQLAREEAQGAETRLHEMEELLQKRGDAIDTARQDVRLREENVKKTVESVSEGGADLTSRQDAQREVQKELEGHDTRVSELERQLQRLQEKRTQATQRAVEAREKLGQERARVEGAEETLENLRDEEELARVQLEDTRQQVKDLHRETTAIEANMENARHVLTNKRMSLADIEQTIGQIDEAADTADDTTEMLF